GRRLGRASGRGRGRPPPFPRDRAPAQARSRPPRPPEGALQDRAYAPRSDLQRTPPISRRTGLMSTNMTTAAPSVTAAVTPNRVGSGVVLMNPADQPASLLPSAFERKNTPIMRPTTCFGASLVTTDSPTGLRHSSPSSSMKYTATSHRGLILTPPWAIAPAGMSSTKASPTNSSARANFAGEDGCRGPSFTHNHAKMGDKRITNAAWTDTNQDAYSLMPSSSRWTYRSANSASVDPACS